MHKLTFYPLGNADCCKIDLNNGQKFLFDYDHSKEGESEDSALIDLKEELLNDLTSSNRDYFDIVGFTHADSDHIKGSTDFFYLEHSSKFQGSDRIKIKELWVPAAMIIDKSSTDEAEILKKEARHRLKEGKGIRVFSRPERLVEWLENQGLTLDDRKDLITDAGQLVPGFEKIKQGVEFFVHSPFAVRNNEELEDRNESSLILQITFNIDQKDTNFLLIGDATYESLADIVKVTKLNNNEQRLRWDIYDIPHHCSYLALNDEKGEDKTEPVQEVEWLLKQGNDRGIMVSCSNPIPNNDENPQPPHRQAANCYKEIIAEIDGEFKVTMENPNTTKPIPLVISIDSFGATIKKIIFGGGSIATSKPATRAG